MKHEMSEAVNPNNVTDFSHVLRGLNMVSSGLEVSAETVGPDAEPFSIRSLEDHSRLNKEGAFLVTLGDTRAILRRLGNIVTWHPDQDAEVNTELEDDQIAKMERITFAALKQIQEQRRHRFSLFKQVTTAIVHAAVPRN